MIFYIAHVSEKLVVKSYERIVDYKKLDSTGFYVKIKHNMVGINPLLMLLQLKTLFLSFRVIILSKREFIFSNI